MTEQVDLDALIAEAREHWVSVVGYEGYYEVSDQGRVRSVDRVIEWQGTTKRLEGRILKGTIKQKKGHREVRLSLGGKTRAFTVHKLVLEAFVGPRPEGMEGCHGNGVPDDNRLENLRWDTKSSNNFDRVQHGVHHYAKRTHCAKGHPLSGDNLGKGSRGSRRCRECHREAGRLRRERERAND